VITPEQCRAGRKLLGWNGLKLAQAAGVDPITLIRFETGKGPLSANALKAVQNALEAAGVVLVGRGVQLRLDQPKPIREARLQSLAELDEMIAKAEEVRDFHRGFLKRAEAAGLSLQRGQNLLRQAEERLTQLRHRREKAS
jgi:transcriptional regulator with XRE-family HTH domain